MGISTIRKRNGAFLIYRPLNTIRTLYTGHRTINQKESLNKLHLLL